MKAPALKRPVARNDRWLRPLPAPQNRLFIFLIFLIPALGGCSGPEPHQSGIIGYNLTFSVAVYSWLIIYLVTIARHSKAIPQRLLLYQLGLAVVISAGLSVFLFRNPRDIYWIFSKSPFLEWCSLQLYSFLFLPFIGAYVLLAYLITVLPFMRRYRPYSLSVAVIVHWLFCAHFFLVR